jgi:hypothetical protein
MLCVQPRAGMAVGKGKRHSSNKDDGTVGKRVMLLRTKDFSTD